MKFLKENSYDIVKLYINQIGIAIFSLLLYFSVGMLKDADVNLRLKIAISIFAMLFYFVLLYTAAWDMGAKDKIRIDAGKIKENKFKGLLMALAANALNFILAGGCMLTMGIYISNSSAAVGTISMLLTMILRMTCSMYLGLMQGIFISFNQNAEFYNFIQSCGFLAAPILAIASTHIGYRFGLKNKKIFSSTKTKS